MGEYQNEQNNEQEQERQREARRAAIRAEIARLEGKKAKLEEYKQQLIEQEEKTDHEVLKPVSDYDLTVSTDIAHWQGVLESDGETKRNTLASGIGTFISGINTVISTIENVIARIQARIDQLRSELASI